MKVEGDLSLNLFHTKITTHNNQRSPSRSVTWNLYAHLHTFCIFLKPNLTLYFPCIIPNLVKVRIKIIWF